MAGDQVPNTWRAEHGYVQVVQDPFLFPIAPTAQQFEVQLLPMPMSVPQMPIAMPWPMQPQQYPYPIPPLGQFIPVPIEAKKEKKKEKSKPSTKRPKVKPGFPYLYPRGSVISIHLFAAGTDANELTDGQSHHAVPEISCFSVANSTTFKSLVSMLGLKEKSVVYNINELGDGRWGKGVRIDTAGDDGKKTLEGVGFVPDRPIWLVIQKPKKK